MKPTERFDQVKALIDRVCQAGGASIDAHEKPFPDPGLTLVEAAQESAQTVPPTVEPTEEELFEETCGLRHLFPDFKWGRSLAPEPISDEFEWAGSTVWESEELTEIYRGFQQAVGAGVTQPVRTETGIYRLSKPPGLNWQLLDPGKGFLYVQEKTSTHLELPEEDLFIWVLINGTDTCLGYIHEAYVFLKKKEEECE